MDDIVIKRKPIHYEHDVVFYVPVYQKNFDENGEPCTPTFEYSLNGAYSDLQMVESFEPDYILELKGYFNAITKPVIIKGDD